MGNSLAEILRNPLLPQEEKRDIAVVYDEIIKLKRATSRQITENRDCLLDDFPKHALRMENALYVLENAGLIRRDKTTGQYLPN